jgi:hypothetical protein
MEGQNLKPEAFDEPFRNELFENLNEHTVRLAAQIVLEAGGESISSAATEAFKRMKEANVKLATIVRRVESITSRMQEGTVQPKELRAFLREISDRMGRTTASPDSPSARNQAEMIQSLAKSAKFVGEVLAKAAMYRRMTGRRTPVAIEHVDFHRIVAPAVAPLVPFFNPRDMKAATEHFVWCYNEQHPEDQLDFNRPGETKKFAESLAAVTKLHANKWVAAAALGIGLMGAGVFAPELPGMVVHLAGAAAGLFIGHKLYTIGMDRILNTLKTPKGRFYSMGSEWRKLSDNMEQVVFRKQEIVSPALNAIYDVDNIIRKASMQGKGLVRRGMEFLFPSKESNDRYEAFSEMLADRHDKLTELPSELKPAEEYLRKIFPAFAKMLRDEGIPTRDDYFPKVYRHEGLQALKEDPEALAALADHIVPQILENSPEKVASWKLQFSLASDRQIAFNLALHALNAIYDGSEKMAFGIARRRDDEAHDFAIRAATRSGEMNKNIYRKIRAAMEKSAPTYQSGHLKKRKIEFDIPKDWQLTDGTKVQLVDRNLIRVAVRYSNQIALTLAQKQIFESDLAVKLLTSLGGKDSDKRREMDHLIRQGMNNVLNQIKVDVKTDGNGKVIEIDDRKAIRAVYSARSKINSVLYIGLNIAAPFLNLLYSESKASVLADTESWIKAGRIVAMQMLPGLRNTEHQKMLRTIAKELGAVLRMASPGFSGQKNMFDAFMSLNARSWETVDVASFYLGRVMAPKIIQEALSGKEREYHTNFLREIYGDRYSTLLSGGPTELTEEDLNRAGLVYQKLISGYGMTHFRPQFMNSEHGRAWLQFMPFLAEDTKFINDRILHGPRQNWLRLGRGLVLAGILAWTLKFALSSIPAFHYKKPEISDHPDIFIYQMAQIGGGMANYEKIAKAFVRQDPAEKAEPFDAIKELTPLPVNQVLGTLRNALETYQNFNIMHDARVPLEERPGVYMAPFFRSAAKLPPARLLWGGKFPKTSGEQRIEDFRREARENRDQ